MFRKMFALSKKGAGDLLKASLACAASNVSLMLPFVLLVFLAVQLFKPLTGGETRELSLWFFCGASAALVCGIFFAYRFRYRATYFSTYAESSNRRIRLAEKLRRLPLSFFGEKNLSDLTNTMMNDCAALELAFSDSIPQLFGSVISVSAAAVILFFIDWRMALSLFITVPFALLLVMGSKKFQDKLSGNNLDAEASASDGVQEYLEGIKVIKACAMAKKCRDEIEIKLDNTVKASLRMAFGAGKFVFSAQSILHFGLALTALAGAYLLSAGQIAMITYALFLMASSLVYDPVAGILMQITLLFEAKQRIDRMKELENHPVQEGAKECSLPHYDIEFKNVSFSYKDEKIVRSVSFTAKQGEVTAVVGPSGSGKTTLAKLAARFWDAQDGCVMLGGKDVKTIEPEALLANFSIVFQDVALFNDTLFNNIKIGKLNASKEEIVAAAQAAQCDEFIRRLPLGYDTVIGENGSTLSGGERQRISIARAILKDAPVILLDEATASLDTENEILVQAALSRLIENKTLLVIAHRFSTIRYANQILVLDKGRIAQRGAHDELVKKDGLYKRLWKIQEAAKEWTIA